VWAESPIVGIIESVARPERQITIGDRGRIVLPAAVRAQLGLEPGTRMLVSAEQDGSVRLRPYRSVADRHRGILAGLGDGAMVDDLIAERRDAAAREDEA
jgi:AbrB family looped-hinge helix DNA binding protein